jgi:hypothetical protein
MPFCIVPHVPIVLSAQHGVTVGSMKKPPPPGGAAGAEHMFDPHMTGSAVLPPLPPIVPPVPALVPPLPAPMSLPPVPPPVAPPEPASVPPLESSSPQPIAIALQTMTTPIQRLDLFIPILSN